MDRMSGDNTHPHVPELTSRVLPSEKHRQIHTLSCSIVVLSWSWYSGTPLSHSFLFILLLLHWDSIDIVEQHVVFHQALLNALISRLPAFHNPTIMPRLEVVLIKFGISGFAVYSRSILGDRDISAKVTVRCSKDSGSMWWICAMIEKESMSSLREAGPLREKIIDFPFVNIFALQRASKSIVIYAKTLERGKLSQGPKGWAMSNALDRLCSEYKLEVLKGAAVTLKRFPELTQVHIRFVLVSRNCFSFVPLYSQILKARASTDEV
ncbi:hypothetical protein AC579_2015 [Pseudocercospora musae]|uniref:Uncharacterized protein n=1 Tax=Pseudocercospora musae TaxID=113226 RepID=A0A139IQN5_9PEZI|nr:hypothetical protein AC579_2015 [Pseudocercospora musae]